MRAGPGYVVRIRPADVGSRVSVRSISGERYRDVVGELLSWADGILRIRRRDGSIVDVAEDLVVAGKVVPPAPRRQARAGTAAAGIDDLELEEIAGSGWQGFESSWLGRWLLRASAGFTGRANSVLPLGDAGLASRGARPGAPVVRGPWAADAIPGAAAGARGARQRAGRARLDHQRSQPCADGADLGCAGRGARSR